MKPIPFEDFLPNWSSALVEDDDQSDEDRERMKSKFIAALKAASAKPPPTPGVQKSGKATLRPKPKQE